MNLVMGAQVVSDGYIMFADWLSPCAPTGLSPYSFCVGFLEPETLPQMCPKNAFG
jgi:hypothetical protein